MFPSAAELGYQIVDRANYSPAKLARFIWFNPTLSKTEQDGEKKILSYYPKDGFTAFEQAQSVGLVQGIAGFTTQFAPDETCQTLTTKKHKLSFFSPEPDFFLVIMVEVPKTQEGDKEVYLEREIEPGVLKQAVRQAYDAFFFMHGRLADQMKERGPEGLKTLLAGFMTAYLPALDMSQADIFGVLDGVSFLPMQRETWLQSQCFVNEAEQMFPAVCHTALFFKENLVCSTLDVDLLRPACRYLFAFPSHSAQTRGQSSGTTPEVLALSHRNGKVHLGHGEPLHMMVLRLGEVMVVFFLSALDSGVEAMMKYVSKVGKLIPEMRESYDRMMRGDHYRFIYYNAHNTAIKNAMGGSRRVTRDTLQVVGSMHTSLEHANEIVARHGSNFVVAKKVDKRELYVIFEGSNDNTLLDVENKFQQMAANVLSGIYF